MDQWVQAEPQIKPEIGPEFPLSAARLKWAAQKEWHCTDGQRLLEAAVSSPLAIAIGTGIVLFNNSWHLPPQNLAYS